MTERLSTACLYSVIILSVLLCGATIAYAQTEGIQMRPAIIEDRVDPGAVYEFSVRATNVSDGERTYYIGAEDIVGMETDGTPIFAQEGEPTPYDLSTWVSIPQQSVTIAAGETVTIPFSVRVPREASPGSHFGSIFLGTDPPELGATGAAIGVRVGSIISLRISGEITEDMRLREFSTDKFIYDSANVTFNSRVENLGNVLLRPHGLIEITDMFGKQVASLRINETAAGVFPESERTYATEWSHEGFAFGRYQAVASIVYGEEGRKTITATASLWILPLKPILTALGTLLGVVVLLYLVMRLYIRRKLREMGVDVGKRGQSDYYAKKYQRSASRMMFVVLAIFLFCIVFLVALFYLFA
jgi:hypothetical protein